MDAQHLVRWVAGGPRRGAPPGEPVEAQTPRILQ
jgi:hypothetical protein